MLTSYTTIIFSNLLIYNLNDASPKHNCEYFFIPTFKSFITIGGVPNYATNIFCKIKNISKSLSEETHLKWNIIINI